MLHRVCCTVGVSITIAVPRSRRESFGVGWLRHVSNSKQQQTHRPAQQRVRPAAARRRYNGGTRGEDGLLLTRRDHHAAVGVVVVQLLNQWETFAVRSIRSTRLYTRRTATSTLSARQHPLATAPPLSLALSRPPPSSASGTHLDREHQQD